MKKESKELATIATGLAPIEPPPAWVTEGTAGFEGINAQDLVLPRLMICQALSPQRQEDRPEYIPDLEEGDFFNAVSKEVFGRGPHLVTPLACSKSRLKFVENKKMNSGIACMGVPCPPDRSNLEGIACQLNAGGPCLHAAMDDPDRCFLVYNFPVVFYSRPQAPLVISLKSTGVKIAKNWLSMMRMRGRFPMYAMSFSVSSVRATTPKGTFMQPRFDNAGWTPQELADACRQFYDSVRDRVILTDQEQEDDETSTQSSPRMSREEREPGEEQGY